MADPNSCLSGSNYRAKRLRCFGCCAKPGRPRSSCIISSTTIPRSSPSSARWAFLTTSTRTISRGSVRVSRWSAGEIVTAESRRRRFARPASPTSALICTRTFPSPICSPVPGAFSLARGVSSCRRMTRPSGWHDIFPACVPWSFRTRTMAPSTIRRRFRSSRNGARLRGRRDRTHKGFHALLACARDARKRDLDLTFVVAGRTIDDQRLIDTGRVFVTGPYRPEEARRADQSPTRASGVAAIDLAGDVVPRPDRIVARRPAGRGVRYRCARRTHPPNQPRFPASPGPAAREDQRRAIECRQGTIFSSDPPHFGLQAFPLMQP